MSNNKIHGYWVRIYLNKLALLTTIFILTGCAVAVRDSDNQTTNILISNKYETVFESMIAGNTLAYDPILIRASDGGYVIAGGVRGDTWVGKTNQVGKLLWQKTVVTGQANGQNTLLEMSDGGYVVAGHMPVGDSAYATKFDKNGQPVWTKNYPSTEGEAGGSERDPLFWRGKLMLFYQLVRRLHETYSPSYLYRRVQA